MEAITTNRLSTGDAICWCGHTERAHGDGCGSSTACNASGCGCSSFAVRRPTPRQPAPVDSRVLTAEQVVTIARGHLSRMTEGFRGSASMCFDQADRMLAAGDDAAARRWAARSLEFSVGIFHADYRLAAGVAEPAAPRHTGRDNWGAADI